ncbi:MAG: YicC/YloC family endoribonuclease [Ignavibacteriaceae bacterium]
MIHSMTGFGKGSIVTRKITIEAEVKSGNSRYLEMFIKLPQFLSHKEYELRELVKDKIKRGKINIFIQIKRDTTLNGSSAFDEEKLKSYLKVLKQIKKTANLSEGIKLEHLLNNKEFIASSDYDLSEAEFNKLKKSLNTALNNLQIMKKNEGRELAKDLIKRIRFIENNVNEIGNESKNSINDYYGKLKERITELLDDSKISEERLNLELALIADKADITEESVRLKSHLKFFIECIKKEAEPGRKLNFLCQEMNREANTISSKSISISITHKVVLIKEEIEKIREQIQNIE